MKSNEDLERKAIEFVGMMAQGDFGSAYRQFDETMAHTISEARLKETWEQLVRQVGLFQSVVRITASEIQSHLVVTATSQFEKAPIDVRVVFNSSGQVAGLNYQPASLDSPYNPPSYVEKSAFRESEVTIGQDEWALPGTLSLPNGAGPFPAIVLVHGSGPQDRDETIGANKPFRDLAWGLASRGIAVLRYDKRTKVHGARMSKEIVAHITVQEETIDDALAAVRLLRQTRGIDARRILVLGHSLGATLAPRIGEQDPAIAGLIIMAGLTRPLEDTVLDQYKYLYSLSGPMTKAQRAELEQLKEQVARAKDPNLSGQVPAKDLPLGIHPAYWLALRGYRPAEVAASLAMPILVLQGGRDYQVTVAGDFSGWQDALKGKPNATLKLYPKLFHLFMPGEGPSTPQEYLTEGHVSPEVIDDIASWIAEH